MARLMLVVALLAGPVMADEFMLGVEVFLAGHTKLVRGKRVGLLTNQTGRDARGRATVDLLHRHPQVKLVALFAPEHGIRGEVAAGEHIDDSRDPATGLPVYSLYGIKGHAPTTEMLAEVDVLIYDIQDVGSRAYTYIWSMAETLAACGREGKALIVLDRPNPMTLQVVDGPLTEERWKSFLGLYPIPRVYGMTVGELAAYFNAEYKLRCSLAVIPMAGYTRQTTWAQTGLTWTASSPNIPSVQSALCFAATGTIGTLGVLDIGIGGERPFQTVGASWIDAERSCRLLNARKLPGVRFRPVAPYEATRGPFRGKRIEALYIEITDPSRFFASTIEVVLLDHLSQHYHRHFRWRPDTFDSFDKAFGTSEVRVGLMTGQKLSTIIGAWQEPQQRFLERRRGYLLYR